MNQPIKVNPIIKWLLLPKAIWLWLNYRVGVWLLKKRNKIMPFVIHPDPRLARVSEPVDFRNESRDELSAIVRKMGTALANASYGGKLGLAAPQIGINKRIFIMQGAVMFNPEWSGSQAPKSIGFEGCYSVPHKVFKVARDVSGWARWQSIDGEWREFKFNGLKAIIYQHELDHLNGKCCADVGVEVQPE